MTNLECALHLYMQLYVTFAHITCLASIEYDIGQESSALQVFFSENLHTNTKYSEVSSTWMCLGINLLLFCLTWISIFIQLSCWPHSSISSAVIHKYQWIPLFWRWWWCTSIMDETLVRQWTNTGYKWLYLHSKITKFLFDFSVTQSPIRSLIVLEMNFHLAGKRAMTPLSGYTTLTTPHVSKPCQPFLDLW